MRIGVASGVVIPFTSISIVLALVALALVVLVSGLRLSAIVTAGHAMWSIRRRRRIPCGCTVVDGVHSVVALGHYSAPFVLGMPFTRGSGSTATRSARARALNSDSAM